MYMFYLSSEISLMGMLPYLPWRTNPIYFPWSGRFASTEISKWLYARNLISLINKINQPALRIISAWRYTINIVICIIIFIVIYSILRQFFDFLFMEFGDAFFGLSPIEGSPRTGIFSFSKFICSKSRTFKCFIFIYTL